MICGDIISIVRNVSLTYNLLLAFVIFLGGQLLGAGQKVTPNQSSSPEGPQLHLRAGAFDPLTQPASIHRRVQPRMINPALRLVQFTGPVQDAWLESLRSCGLGIVGYVPDYAYVVWGTAYGYGLPGAARLRCAGLVFTALFMPYTPPWLSHSKMKRPE